MPTESSKGNRPAPTTIQASVPKADVPRLGGLARAQQMTAADRSAAGRACLARHGSEFYRQIVQKRWNG